MKRWMKYFIVGVTVLLIFSMTGCGGVSHKSPEKVTEELINAYAKGKEKKAIAESIKKAEESVEAMKVARKSMLKYNSSFAEGLQISKEN